MNENITQLITKRNLQALSPEEEALINSEAKAFLQQLGQSCQPATQLPEMDAPRPSVGASNWPVVQNVVNQVCPANERLSSGAWYLKVGPLGWLGADFRGSEEDLALWRQTPMIVVLEDHADFPGVLWAQALLQWPVEDHEKALWFCNEINRRAEGLLLGYLEIVESTIPGSKLRYVCGRAIQVNPYQENLFATELEAFLSNCARIWRNLPIE